MATTDVFFMARCPRCGEVILHRQVSLFTIQGRGKVFISCPCGFLLCAIAPQGKKHYGVDIWSDCCEGPHRFVFTLGQLLKNCLALACSRTDFHLGYLGDRESVLAEVMESDILSLTDGSSLWDFFADMEVMERVLKRLYILLSGGKVQCHDCGGDIDVRIYRDRISVHCPHCSNGGYLFAAKEQDLLLMEQAEGLILEKEGINMIYGNKIK